MVISGCHIERNVGSLVRSSPGRFGSSPAPCSGMFAVTQASLGPRRVLRPGDYFGEVALAMEIPRTASVRALTPSTVASCDRETFDEFIRPLFAES